MDGKPPTILYEDNHIIAVNKMPSDIVQGDKSGDVTLADRVRQYLKERYGKPGNVFLGIPHRLDRPTSGVVIFARTEKALQRMSALFRDGGVRKIYWAVLCEKPDPSAGDLAHWLRRNEKLNKSFVMDGPSPDAKEAHLSYRTLLSLDRYHLVEVELHTGRHHQIRAQFAAIGCHIKGDLKYGAPRSNAGGGIHLHARAATFLHPVGAKELSIIAEPPDDPVWNAAREALRKK